jgi:large subunit ribosomal protein L4
MAGLSAPVVGGKRGETVDLQEGLFGVEPRATLLHEAVRAEQAALRQGTHATRSRGMVAGGRAKPWRQKGTGRARAGTTRAPQWTGGGVAFGPSPRRHDLKVNRKAAHKARAMALSRHAAEGTLGVFDAGSFDAPRTKDALALLEPWRSERPCLVVLREDEANAGLSFRNVDRVHLAEAGAVGVAELLRARTLLVSRSALDAWQGGEDA